MKTAAAQTHYSLRQVQSLLGLAGLSRAVIVRLVDAGFVAPARGARGALMFSLQDLMLLRTAHSLQQASIPTRRILAALRKLKASLPAELPLTGLRITAVGSEVAVRAGGADCAAESGQWLMDFVAAPVGGSVSFFSDWPSPPAPPAAGRQVGGDWLAQLQALEQTQPQKAEAGYRRALAGKNQPNGMVDPVDAYLNFGAFLCNSGRSKEALALYAEALSRRPDCADLWFNQSLAFEDLGLLQQAAAGYRQCVALAPTFADAHYNLGLLLERLGDKKAALRHFNAYRQLNP